MLEPAWRNLGACIAGDAVTNVPVSKLHQNIAERLVDHLALRNGQKMALTMRCGGLDQIVARQPRRVGKHGTSHLDVRMKSELLHGRDRRERYGCEPSR